MRKILLVSTLGRQFRLFESVNIAILQELGCQIHAAADFSDPQDRFGLSAALTLHQLDIARSPLACTNLRALRQLVDLLRREHFDAVHCHSPVGGVLARLAAARAGLTNVIYTAHGFHFYSGAPVTHWALLYPVERLLARWTRVLVTMNDEDYRRAQRFPAEQVVRVPGVGVDTMSFRLGDQARCAKRRNLGLEPEVVAIVTVGEMIARKNLRVLIEAFDRIASPRSFLLVCGTGRLENELKAFAAGLRSTDRIRFLGYRRDVGEVLGACDIYATSSLQEGLPVSVIEAMAARLPVLGSDIRGVRDLVDVGVNGLLHDPRDVDGYADSLGRLVEDRELRTAMGARSLQRSARYDRAVVSAVMRDVYAFVLGPAGDP